MLVSTYTKHECQRSQDAVIHKGRNLAGGQLLLYSSNNGGSAPRTKYSRNSFTMHNNNWDSTYSYRCQKMDINYYLKKLCASHGRPGGIAMCNVAPVLNSEVSL